MARTAIVGLRLAASLLWAAAVVTVIGIALLGHIAPLVGSQLIVIRGSSMAPAIPVGSTVLVSAHDPDTVEPGEVVTVRADNGVLITHRVTGVRRPATVGTTRRLATRTMALIRSRFRPARSSASWTSPSREPGSCSRCCPR